MDRLADLIPDLRCGERVTLLATVDGVRTDVLGFVTTVDESKLTVVDRRGVHHRVRRADVIAGKRAPIARGINPLSTPRDLLDDLAARAGVSGERVWVARISDLLAGCTPPCSVAAWGSWAEFGSVRARFEGEWVTLPLTAVDTIRQAAWWGTRMGARSVQVRGGAADQAPDGFVGYPLDASAD